MLLQGPCSAPPAVSPNHLTNAMPRFPTLCFTLHDLILLPISLLFSPSSPLCISPPLRSSLPSILHPSFLPQSAWNGEGSAAVSEIPLPGVVFFLRGRGQLLQGKEREREGLQVCTLGKADFPDSSFPTAVTPVAQREPASSLQQAIRWVDCRLRRNPDCLSTAQLSSRQLSHFRREGRSGVWRGGREGRHKHTYTGSTAACAHTLAQTPLLFLSLSLARSLAGAGLHAAPPLIRC